MSATTSALALGVGATPSRNRLLAFLASPTGLVTLLGTAYAMSLLFTGLAHAQTGNTNVFAAMFYKAQDLFYNLRYLSLLVGAIAVIAIMVGAFAGKFPVQKAIVFSFAIIMIASSGMIVSYFASGGTTSNGAAITSTSSGVGQSQIGTNNINDTEGTGND